MSHEPEKNEIADEPITFEEMKADLVAAGYEETMRRLVLS